MKITAHVLVENEENFVWFAIMSVLPFVDEILICDAGSIDQTPRILKEIKKRAPEKITIYSTGKLAPEDYPKARDEMIKNTKSDWILIVDGDEVWWHKSISDLSTSMRSNRNIDSYVTRFVTCVGDIFHVQPESAGQYRIGNLKGHLTLRAINAHIPGLHVAIKYPHEGYFDGEETLIQNRDEKHRVVQSGVGYMHLTHLPRTLVNRDKFKYEIGIALPLDYYYPEAFFEPRPEIVPSPWQNLSLHERSLSGILQMPRQIKRWTK